MNDAIEMTYLDLLKRRQQQEMNSSNTNKTDTIPKSTSSTDDSHQLTTQSSFTDISDLPTIKDNTKTKTNRKVSTTTNDTTRKIFEFIFIIHL